MADKEERISLKELSVLKKCFEDTIWMAIRYAHGRGTYAPGMVRDAIRDFKKVFPDWKPREDTTIQPPKDGDLNGIFSIEYYLDDLFEK